MGSHSAKLRKYSNAVSCAKTWVRTVCRNGSHATVAKHTYLAARRDRPSAMATTWHAHRLEHTGRRGSKWVADALETHTSLLYISKILSFFLSFVQKRKWANRCDFEIFTETTSTSVGITAGSTQWAPLNSIYFNFFGLSQGWRKFLRARDQTVDNFRRNSLPCGNVSLLASYFQLCQWCLSAP